MGKKAIKHGSKDQRRSARQKFKKITTNGVKIMPTKLKKYEGCVYKRKYGWQVRFCGERYKGSKSFKTREEANAYLIDINDRENLPKNIVYEYRNEYYCVLSQGQIMKFSSEHMHLVQKHIWYANWTGKDYYAYTERGVSFPCKMFPTTGARQTGDHITPGKKLDNTNTNVRIATKTTQSINRDILKNNKSGVTGVFYNKRTCCWVGKWTGDDGVEQRRAFSVKKYSYDLAYEKAVVARKEGEQNTERYRIAFNHD